jgi:peptidoglycan/LPS O-acetylase OafA/YrhL
MVMNPQSDDRQSSSKRQSANYWRFATMIATSMAAMFVLMYVNTFAWDHVRWSETRLYMTFVMGASMAGIMLSFMLGMYKSTKINIGIFVASVLVLVGAIWLVRSQATVEDRSYMSAMIPHHSIAILTSERSTIEDTRVCELAVGIIEAQRREIAEMDWLISDIAENGPAETAAEAESRPVPDFQGTATRTCADG